MTDETEDPSADPLRAVFRAGWKRQEQVIPGRRSAAMSVHVLLKKIAATDVEMARDVGASVSVSRHPVPSSDWELENNATPLSAGIGARGQLGRQIVRGSGIIGVRSRTLRAWRWPAIALGLLAVVIGIIRLGAPKRHDGTRSYTTRADQQATMIFPDGTRVTLAPNTTLQLAYLGTSSRTVTLVNGEAYFTIAHAAESPFLVRSGAVMTRVLGTDFLVRHDRRSAHVRVAVEGGKVLVTTTAHPDSGVALAAGQIGDVTDSTIHVEKVDAIVPGAEWAPGHLLFRHTAVATVLQTLSRWYGYQFRYADRTLAERSVTIGVSTQSSAEALATLEQVLAVNLTVVGDTVTLVSHTSQPGHGIPRVRSYDIWTPTSEAGR